MDYLILYSCPLKIHLLEVRDGIPQNQATIQAMAHLAVLSLPQAQPLDVHSLLILQNRVHILSHLPVAIITVAHPACPLLHRL